MIYQGGGISCFIASGNCCIGNIFMRKTKFSGDKMNGRIVKEKNPDYQYYQIIKTVQLNCMHFFMLQNGLGLTFFGFKRSREVYHMKKAEG